MTFIIQKLCIVVFVTTSVFFVNESYADDLTDTQICRAGISTIWNQKLEDVTVDRTQLNIVYVSFPPNSSGTSSAFKCVVNGDKIVWGTTFGNWRDTDLDSVIEFNTKGGVLFVRERHNNGSIFLKKFNLNDLGEKK